MKIKLSKMGVKKKKRGNFTDFEGRNAVLLFNYFDSFFGAADFTSSAYNAFAFIDWICLGFTGSFA